MTNRLQPHSVPLLLLGLLLLLVAIQDNEYASNWLRHEVACVGC
jgi:hypothetical protein